MMILVTQLERAGAQKNAFMQAHHFHHIGYDVTLCVFYDKYRMIDEVSKKVPFKIVSLEAKVIGHHIILNALKTVRAVWRLYRLLKKEKIQIIETLQHYSNLIGPFIAWVAGVPVRISSQRNTLNFLGKSFLCLDALIVNSPLVDKMISVSENTRQFCIKIEGIKPHKLVTIPNGIDLTEFNRNQWLASELNHLRESLGLTAKSHVLLTLARLHPIKGHTYLIQAAPLVLEEFPEAAFLLVGKGEYRLAIEREINKYHLQDIIFMLDGTKDAPKFMAMSDLLVLPSINEGMPNVVLEAMAAKLPVVATGIDGTKELVVDRITGLLVPPKNPYALADAIISLLKDENMRREMAEKAYKRAKNYFSKDVMCRRFEEVIQSIVINKMKR